MKRDWFYMLFVVMLVFVGCNKDKEATNGGENNNKRNGPEYTVKDFCIKMNEIDMNLHPDLYEDYRDEDFAEQLEFCEGSVKKRIELSGANEDEVISMVMTDCRHLIGYDWFFCWVDVQDKMGMGEEDIGDFEYEDYLEE